jgi:uncharacterized YceG family protein
VAEGYERTAEEREAARRAREARRRDGNLGTSRASRMPRAPRMPSASQMPSGPRVPRTRPRHAEPRRPHSRRNRIVALLALVLAGVVVWLAVEVFQPFHGSGHGSVTVVIPPHSGVSAVADQLSKAGVIGSSFWFELRATIDGDRGDLRAGTYHLKRDMSYGAVLKILTTPPPAAPVTGITIVPGRTRRQIDGLLRAQDVKGSYYAATRSAPQLDPRAYGAPERTDSLEGFLFPDTYQLREPVNIATLVADQLADFKRQFARVNMRYARSQHLTPYDVLIIASMVEGEAKTSRDRALVASVIYNRLRRRMPLQIDATTCYIANSNPCRLTPALLNSSSPYNTRTHRGLPPTPIGNPSLAAIEAAAHPAHTNYLYFVVAVCGNGKEVFESNYRRFQRDAQRYQAARAKRRGNSPAHC